MRVTVFHPHWEKGGLLAKKEAASKLLRQSLDAEPRIIYANQIILGEGLRYKNITCTANEPKHFDFLNKAKD